MPKVPCTHREVNLFGRVPMVWKTYLGSQQRRPHPNIRPPFKTTWTDDHRIRVTFAELHARRLGWAAASPPAKVAVELQKRSREPCQVLLFIGLGTTGRRKVVANSEPFLLPRLHWSSPTQGPESATEKSGFRWPARTPIKASL